MDMRFLQLCVLAALLTTTQSDADTLRLINALKLTKLPTDVRPVRNLTHTVQIYYGLALINIESLDAVKGILHLNLWSRRLWRDYSMVWRASDYNGITTLRRPQSDVWLPDLTVYNQREPTRILPVQVVVYCDGSMLHIPLIETKTHCDLDLTYYPFDIQTCSIKIASWTYDGNAIDLDFYEGYEHIDLNDYVPNAEWNILKTEAKHNVMHYPCCVEPFPDFTYYVTIQRKVSYYTYVYLGPAIILSLLVPFIFLLPPGDQQKITLGVGILICLSLFFLKMSTQLPMMHAHIPLIHKYYMATYVLVAMSVALSALVSNLTWRNHTLRDPPKFLTKVMLGCMGRCLCVYYSKANLVAKKQPTDMKIKAGTTPVQHQASTGSQVIQWQMIAAVMDRLLFLAFLVLSVLVALCILTIRPPWDYSTQSWVPTAKRPPGAVAVNPRHIRRMGGSG